MQKQSKYRMQNTKLWLLTFRRLHGDEGGASFLILIDGQQSLDGAVNLPHVLLHLYLKRVAHTRQCGFVRTFPKPAQHANNTLNRHPSPSTSECSLLTHQTSFPIHLRVQSVNTSDILPHPLQNATDTSDIFPHPLLSAVDTSDIFPHPPQCAVDTSNRHLSPSTTVCS